MKGGIGALRHRRGKARQRTHSPQKNRCNPAMLEPESQGICLVSRRVPCCTCLVFRLSSIVRVVSCRVAAWRGVAWRGVAWWRAAWRGVACRGAPCRFVSRRGVAWRGVAWRGAKRHGQPLQRDLEGPKGIPQRTFGKPFGAPGEALGRPRGAFGRGLVGLSASLGGPWGFRNDLGGLLARLGGSLATPLGGLWGA